MIMPWDVLDAETEIIAIHVALLTTSPQALKPKVIPIGDRLAFG
jgi:hypothetical protein